MIDIYTDNVTLWLILILSQFMWKLFIFLFYRGRLIEKDVYQVGCFFVTLTLVGLINADVFLMSQ